MLKEEILRELTEEVGEFDPDCMLAINITIQKTKNKILKLISDEIIDTTDLIKNIKENNKNESGVVVWNRDNVEESYICMRLCGQKMGLTYIQDKIKKVLRK